MLELENCITGPFLATYQTCEIAAAFRVYFNTHHHNLTRIHQPSLFMLNTFKDLFNFFEADITSVFKEFFYGSQTN